MGGNANMHFNFVFHEILKSGRSRGNRYAVEQAFFEEFVRRLHQIVVDRPDVSGIRIYLDDNYLSTFTCAAPVLCSSQFESVSAVPIESIGVAGHCSWEQIRQLSDNGFRILPHGYSHAALSVYSDSILQPTPAGGVYRNVGIGKRRVLSEMEAYFQLNESKRSLLEFKPNEFVLPYGLYNQEIIEINKRFCLYEHLATCDMFIDAGEALRPRILVTQEFSVTQILERVRNLTLRPKDTK